MNYASVVSRLFGRVPTNLSLVSLVEDKTPEAVALEAARTSLAEFDDEPRVIARVGSKFAAVGRTHAVLQDGSNVEVARLPEEEQEMASTVRDLTPVEQKNARLHIKRGRTEFRFGKFRPGMGVMWKGERWIVFDARARGGSKFTLMLVSPDYNRLADEVPPTEIGESEASESDVQRFDGTLADFVKANTVPVDPATLPGEGTAFRRMYLGEFGQLSESESFTPAHLDQLRKQFAKIERVDPSSPTYDKMIKLLGGMTQHQLKQVAGANIKFLSKLALNRVKESVAEASDLDAEVDRVSRDLEYARADARDPGLNAKAKARAQAKVAALDAKFEKLLAQRKAGSSESHSSDGEAGGKWRTTPTGHKIYIDGDGKVTKGNPHVIGKAGDGGGDKPASSGAKSDIPDGFHKANGLKEQPVPKKGKPIGWRATPDSPAVVGYASKGKQMFALVKGQDGKIGMLTAGKVKESVAEAFRMEAGLSYEGKTVLIMRDQGNFGFVVDGEMVEDGFSSRGAAMKAAKAHVDGMLATSESDPGDREGMLFGAAKVIGGEKAVPFSALKVGAKFHFPKTTTTYTKTSDLGKYATEDGRKFKTGVHTAVIPESVDEARYAVGDRVDVRGVGKGKVVRVRKDSANAYEVWFDSGKTQVVWDNPDAVGVPRKVTKIESVDEARGMPHWRTLVDELLELAADVNAETEVSLEVWPGNWNLQLGRGTPKAGRKSAWAEGTIDPGMTPDDAKELAVDMLDQIQARRQHDESVSERSAGAMVAGWKLAGSSTGVTVKSPEGQILYVVLDGRGLRATDASGDEVSASSMPGYVTRAIERMLDTSESLDEAALRMQPGQIWTLSYTGAQEDPDAWLFVTEVQKNGAPAGVKYDVMRKHATFESFRGFNGKFGRQDYDSFLEMVVEEYDQGALQKVTLALAKAGSSTNNFIESLSKRDQDSIAKMAPGAIKQAAIDKARRDAHHATPFVPPAAVEWTQFEGQLVMQRPGSSYVAVPSNGKKSAKTFDVLRVVGERELIAQVKASEVTGYLVKLDKNESVEEARRNWSTKPPRAAVKANYDPNPTLGKASLSDRCAKCYYAERSSLNEPVACLRFKFMAAAAGHCDDWKHPFDPHKGESVDEAQIGTTMSLFLKLEKTVLKKTEGMSGTAPIYNQLIQMLGRVRDAIKGHETKTGDDAVRAFVPAATTAGFMANFGAPLTQLQKHPLVDRDPYKGMLSIRESVDEGKWRTTDDGHKIYIDGKGNVTKGNPHVIGKAAGGKSKSAPKEDPKPSKSDEAPAKSGSPESFEKESGFKGTKTKLGAGQGGTVYGFIGSPDRVLKVAKKASREGEAAKKLQGLDHPGLAKIHGVSTSGGDDLIARENAEPMDGGETIQSALISAVYDHSDGAKSGKEIFDRYVAANQIKSTGKPNSLAASVEKERQAATDFLDAFLQAKKRGVDLSMDLQLGQVGRIGKRIVFFDYGNSLPTSESIDEMAKLSAGGRAEMMRASKESDVQDDTVDWRRTTRAWMDDGKVLEKFDVNFKATGDATYQKARKHSYGWKVVGKIKPELLADRNKLMTALQSTRAKLEQSGWAIESFNPPQ